MDIIRKCLTFVLELCVMLAVIAAVLYMGIYFYSQRSIKCDSRAKLSKLMGVNLDGVKIDDIWYEVDASEGYTRSCVLISETRPSSEREYVTAEEIRDPKRDFIPPGHVQYLQSIGIEMEDVAAFGFNFEEAMHSYWIAPYPIYWYQLQDTWLGEGNVIFLTWIPRKVSMDVEKILAE